MDPIDPLFGKFFGAGLSEANSKIITEQFTTSIVLKAGDLLVKRGAVCDGIGFILSGMCRHYYEVRKMEVTRWISLQHDFVVSLRSFILGVPSIEFIEAVEPSEILVMPKDRWREMYEGHDFFRRFWTSSIEQNYIGMEERVFNLIALPADERYSWMQKNQPQFIRSVPNKYLASMLGIHPRHLSRLRGVRK